MDSSKRYHVYEKLTKKQLDRIWNPDAVVTTLDGQSYRVVALGITADMRGYWTGRRYLIQEAAR